MLTIEQLIAIAQLRGVQMMLSAFGTPQLICEGNIWLGLAIRAWHPIKDEDLVKTSSWVELSNEDAQKNAHLVNLLLSWENLGFPMPNDHARALSVL